MLSNLKKEPHQFASIKFAISVYLETIHDDVIYTYLGIVNLRVKRNSKTYHIVWFVTKIIFL